MTIRKYLRRLLRRKPRLSIPETKAIAWMVDDRVYYALDHMKNWCEQDASEVIEDLFLIMGLLEERGVDCQEWRDALIAEFRHAHD